MPKFRADFYVTGSLVLHQDFKTLVLSSEPFILISNDEADIKSSHILGLDIQVIGDCESINIAIDTLRNALAQKLDVLSFVTQSGFQIEKCRRVIEWEPFQKKRIMRCLQNFNSLFPPEPNLIAGFVDSTQKLVSVINEEYIKRALRYFRYGLIASQLEDQFKNFWLALEIIASNIKGSKPEFLTCYECSSIAKCANCGHMPLRIPVPKDEIKAITQELFPEEYDGIFRNMDKFRNGLLHGRLTESIEQEVGCHFFEVVDIAGTVAWHAIMKSLPAIDTQLEMGARGGNFVRDEMIVGSTLLFEHTEDTEHPSEDKIPKNVKIEMNVSFKPL